MKTPQQIADELAKIIEWANTLLAPRSTMDSNEWSLVCAKYRAAVSRILSERDAEVRRGEDEECAKALCRWCAAGEKVTDLPRQYIPNYGEHEGGFIHVGVIDSNSCYATCDAAAIRARKETHR